MGKQLLAVNLMRRSRCIYIVFILFFLASGCNLNLQWPKEIEILMETPEIRINADVSALRLKDYFGTIMDYNPSGGKVKMINCPNTEVFTMIIYSELIKTVISPPSELADLLDIINEYGGTVPSGLPALIPQASITITAPTLSGTPLEDFSIDSLTARLYISDGNNPVINPDLLNALSVKVGIGGIDNNFKRSQPSGLNLTMTEYTGTSLPGNSGNNLNISLDSNITVNYSVYLIEGAYIPPGTFDGDLTVLAELAIWVPFVFTADKSTTLKLPFENIFADPGKDLFDRNNVSDKSILDNIDNVRLDIVLNTNPFPGAFFVLVNTGTPITESQISGNRLKIIIDRDDVPYPFNPTFSIDFNKGGKLIIPQELKVQEFILKAKIKYTTNFPQLPEGWF